MPKGTFALTTAGYIVGNLDKSLDFYRQVFGLIPYGSVPTRPLMNQAFEKLSNASGARFRQVTLRLPNSGLLFRMVEFGNIERTPRPAPSLLEPGVAYMRFEVSDVETVVANLQRTGARFISPATPQAATKATTILVSDPDGYLLEIAKGVGSQGSNIGAGASPILLSHVVLTTASTNAKIAFYKDVLNAPMTAGAQWQRLPLSGTAEARASLSDDIGGPGRVIELREYRNAPGQRMPFKPRIQDPGAFLLTFFVRDLAEVTKLIQAQELPVVTPEATPVALGSLQRLIVQDPDGVFVELIQE